MYVIGTQTATVSLRRMLRLLRHEGHGAIVDFQTGGPCYNRFPQIQGGGPKEPDLAQLLGWALSHQVSDSLTDIFTGVLMMRF